MEKEGHAGNFDFLKIFYPIFVILNAIRLRVPFFEKKRCLSPILKKESGEIGLEVEGVPVRIFRFYFKIEKEETFIEIGRDIFDKYSKGEKILIEYLVGYDRIHARLIKEA